MEYEIIHELPYGNRKELIKGQLAVDIQFASGLRGKEVKSQKNIRRPRNKEASYEKRGRETERETEINNAKIFIHI